MTANLDLWNRVSKTDPSAVKPITGKQYSGNSPKPYYIVQRLTEEFGPCGKGWGFTILSERMERLTDDDVLHIAHVRLWYIPAGQGSGARCEFDQMGQTKACYRTSKDKLMVDEDAPKKSVTDALVKCASYLGFAGDIFSGRWDDSKYVADLRREFAEQSDDLTDKLKQSIEIARNAKGIPFGKGVTKPTHGAGDDMTDERKQEVQALALDMIAAHREGRDGFAIKAWYDPENFADNDERVYCWSLLASESKLRSTIKANNPITQKETA